MTLPLFNSSLSPDWERAQKSVSYPQAKAAMEQRADDIYQGVAPEQVWLLEHPALYTAGTSAKPSDLTQPDRFPVFAAGRGGQYTYHGPGQRVAYVMMDLSKRGKDIRCYVNQLEGWVIDTLAEFDLSAQRRDGRVGVWVVKPDGSEAKIAAIGVRVRRWVTFHGISINVSPDLTHFEGIVPCGIAEHGVTSLKDLGIEASMQDVDAALLRQFELRFGAVSA